MAGSGRNLDSHTSFAVHSPATAGRKCGAARIGGQGRSILNVYCVAASASIVYDAYDPPWREANGASQAKYSSVSMSPALIGVAPAAGGGYQLPHRQGTEAEAAPFVNFKPR